MGGVVRRGAGLAGVCMLVATVFAGCGGGGASPKTADPSHVASATEWTARLRAASLGCTGVRRNEPLGKKPKESVLCTVGREDVTFFRWKDHAQTVSIVDTTKRQACSFAQKYGLKVVVVVSGDNWTASPQTAGTGQKIARATHGASAVITC